MPIDWRLMKKVGRIVSEILVKDMLSGLKTYYDLNEIAAIKGRKKLVVYLNDLLDSAYESFDVQNNLETIYGGQNEHNFTVLHEEEKENIEKMLDRSKYNKTLVNELLNRVVLEQGMVYDDDNPAKKTLDEFLKEKKDSSFEQTSNQLYGIERKPIKREQERFVLSEDAKIMIRDYIYLDEGREKFGDLIQVMRRLGYKQDFQIVEFKTSRKDN